MGRCVLHEHSLPHLVRLTRPSWSIRGQENRKHRSGLFHFTNNNYYFRMCATNPEINEIRRWSLATTPSKLTQAVGAIRPWGNGNCLVASKGADHLYLYPRRFEVDSPVHQGSVLDERKVLWLHGYPATQRFAPHYPIAARIPSW